MLPSSPSATGSKYRASRPASAASDETAQPLSPTPRPSSDLTRFPPPGGIDHPPIKQDGHPRASALASWPPRSQSSSSFRLSMPLVSPAQLAFSAMQYLPVPVLVLNNLKTVVLANEAMGRMVGVAQESEDEEPEDPSNVQEALRGQTLSQVGIDMIQDGRPVWVTWETFLDSLALEMSTSPAKESKPQSRRPGDTTPKPETLGPGTQHAQIPHSRQGQDTVLDVIISRHGLGKTTYNTRYRARESEYQIYAKMIITIWEIEEQQTYFTLSFTNTQSTPSSLSNPRKSVARSRALEAADRKSIAASTPTSVTSSRGSNSPSAHTSPGVISLSSCPFPPMGPPSKPLHSSAPSILQKITMIKDALLDNSQSPILAMWKDGSVTYPNMACRKLFRKDADLDRPVDGFDLLPNWQIWDEGFSRILDSSEHPIAVLLRTEQPFQGHRFGMYDADGKKVIFDVLGEAIRDDSTGEFLAGVVTCRDVTDMAREITQIKEQDEERFRLICDTMPQLVWTTNADGFHDFFNTRWYHYTGLSPEDSLGTGWKNPFHPDDLREAARRWTHSLATGEPYVTEYRCRSKDGEWRWFLGRALPMRNRQTGRIEKWFGTCTDVNEGTEAKLAANRTRQQLLSVIAHARVTIFTVDMNRKVTMLEGALRWDSTSETGSDSSSKWFLNQDMYAVFNRLDSKLPSGEWHLFLQPIEDILNGKSGEDVREGRIDKRWYRTRFLPVWDKRNLDGRATGENCIDGVIILMMDVTELKEREAAVAEEAKSKRRALANEAAANEANRLKSQFLANMSHEIRTPISGVLGMAELLGNILDQPEQQEYLDNIQRSANALLTVINDILDFSKVESGRLDLEEVQFSLSLVVQDVSKMLSFAASRKDLRFDSDIGGEVEDNLVVIGDPGRVRQIITNLLTNSIKFTTQGYVRFSVQKDRETDKMVEIKFTIQDSGIGIKEEVRRRLFRPFSQGDASTARRFGGTGLGLTICKNLVELMHGRISLESTLGHGTTATFWIPFAKLQGPSMSPLVHIDSLPERLQCEMSVSCASSDRDISTPAASDLGGSPDKNPSPRRQKSVSSGPATEVDLPLSERAKILVLVVEDNVINQKIATKFVTMLGFDVTAVWNGKEALDYLRLAHEGETRKPDIILMDVQMPVVDGYKATHVLRHHLPYKEYAADVPIVAMTASAIQGDREKCTRAGMDDYLAKPVKSKTLERMLVRWSLSKRQRGSLTDASRWSMSDCSEAVEQCSITDRPTPEKEEEDGGGSLLPECELPGISPPSTITPPPLKLENLKGPELSPWDSSPVLADSAASRNREAAELALHLQSEKLMDAAGAGTDTSSRKTLREPSAGHALTEANVEKLEKGGG